LGGAEADPEGLVGDIVWVHLGSAEGLGHPRKK